MTVYAQTLGSIIVLAAIILLIVRLRHIGMLNAGYGTLFANLVTKLTLPATIFYALSHAVLAWKYLTIAIVIFVGELVLLVITRLIASRLHLSSAQMGSFLLAAVFGSSALLGYPLIAQAFPHNLDAMAEAVFVSELGVGLPLFTLGVFIAIHYGRKEQEAGGILTSVWVFFRSPVFMAIVAGTLWSVLNLPLHEALIEQIFDAIQIIANANTLFVTLLVGVSLRFDGIKQIMGIVLVAIALKLVLSPVLCTLPAYSLHLEAWQLQVLLIESAMPSAMLSVALAKRYGCDTELASKLVFATLVCGIVSVVLMMWLMG